MRAGPCAIRLSAGEIGYVVCIVDRRATSIWEAVAGTARINDVRDAS